MNSFERTMAAISHKEPDRVPLFLLFASYGAKELQIPIKEYFSSSDNIVKAQLQMKEKYQSDCIYNFFYAALEVEAFGGEVIFTDDGPPNAGEPFIKSFDMINDMEIPKINQTKCLGRVLDATEKLKKEVGNDIPIIGVVMSPFSSPVMQMGFEKYLDLMYFNKPEFELLMAKNQEFAVEFANAQLQAGATAICYFDPLASPNIIEKEKYLETGYKVAKQTISKIKGPTATHLASGIALPVLDEIAKTGSLVLGFSVNDNLKEIKEAAKNKICLLGNLNGIEMINWDRGEIEKQIKNIIKNAGNGGGLIISDNHGEIPWQTPERVLLELSEAVREFGKYPLKKV